MHRSSFVRDFYDASRRHRRRQAVAAAVSGAGAVAALVVGLSVGVGRPHGAARPVGATPSVPTSGPHPPVLDPGAVVRHGALQGIAANARGDLLTVWVWQPTTGRQAAAWSLRGPDGPHAGMLPDPNGVEAVVQVPGGFALLGGRNGRTGVVVRLDGTTSPVRWVGTGSPGPGMAAVRDLHHGGAIVVDPATGTSFRLPRPPGVVTANGITPGTVNADGTYWTASTGVDGSFGVEQLRGGQWHRQVLEKVANAGGFVGVDGGANGVWAASGNHLAAALEDYYAPGAGRLLLSRDGGSSWQILGAGEVPFAGGGNVAATTGGTLYVLDHSDRLWRSTDSSWARFTQLRVPRPGRGYVLLGAGDRVLVGDLSSGLGWSSYDDAGRRTAAVLR